MYLLCTEKYGVSGADVDLQGQRSLSEWNLNIRIPEGSLGAWAEYLTGSSYSFVSKDLGVN